MTEVFSVDADERVKTNWLKTNVHKIGSYGLHLDTFISLVLELLLWGISKMGGKKKKKKREKSYLS